MRRAGGNTAVFISHASEDEAVAKLAREKLDRFSMNPYLAVTDSGRDIVEPAAVLSERLDGSTQILVLWSRSAANAPWIAWEWRAFFVHHGQDRCEIIMLDDTPFPNNVSGIFYDPPSEWFGVHRLRTGVPSLRPPRKSSQTPPGSLLYITASPGGVAIAEHLAEQGSTHGYTVVEVWKLPSDCCASATARPGDWLLVANDEDVAPRGWERAFGDDPNWHPRRLVLTGRGAWVPSLLRQAPSRAMQDRAGIEAWLAVPEFSQVLKLLWFSPQAWTGLAQRVHDGIASNFPWLDTCLGSIDVRLRRKLTALRLGALATALMAHLIGVALTSVLPLEWPEITRRHLVLSATMVLFASIAVESASFPAAVTVATYGGILGSGAVVISGLVVRAGAPPVAFGAGVVLAVIAATDAMLRPSYRSVRNHLSGVVTSAAAGIGFALGAILLGLLGFSKAGNLDELSPVERFAWGLSFGILGGGAVGGALGWLRLYFLRTRDRSKAAHLALWGAALAAPVTAATTAFGSGKIGDWFNGLGIGLFCGALLVGLVLAPTAAMRGHIHSRWLGFISCGLAITTTGSIVQLFPSADREGLIVPMLVVGFVVGCALTLRPLVETRER